LAAAEAQRAVNHGAVSEELVLVADEILAGAGELELADLPLPAVAHLEGDVGVLEEGAAALDVVDPELDEVAPVLVADIAREVQAGAGVLEADGAVVLEAVVLPVVPVVPELLIAVDVDGEVAALTGQGA